MMSLRLLSGGAEESKRRMSWVPVPASTAKMRMGCCPWLAVPVIDIPAD
jgi:hypothetical protein